MTLIIRADHLRFIWNHARSTYPEECCGFLVGVLSDRRRVERIVPAANRNQDSRRTRYFIDPLHLIRADEEAQELGMYIIVIYHSHPDAPASPSRYDLEGAWPSYTYLIVSIQKGGPAGSAAWILSPDGSTFHPDHLEVIAGR